MGKYDEVTEEHKAQFAPMIDKWVRLGLSCGPVNQERAKAAVILAYKCAGFEPPKFFHFVKGPLEGVEKARELKRQYKAEGKPNCGEIGSELNEMTNGHQASWLARFDAFRTIFGAKEETAKVVGLLACAEECGWWASYDENAIIQDRPEYIKRNNAGRLHCPTGPAVRYGDGLEIYSYNGVVFTDEKTIQKCFRENPDVTLQDIANCPNAEQRRCMVDMLGLERLEQSCKLVAELPADYYVPGLRGAATLEFSPGGEDDEGNTLRMRFVRLTNSTAEPDGTFKKYLLRVSRDIDDPHEALARLYGMERSEYNPHQET